MNTPTGELLNRDTSLLLLNDEGASFEVIAQMIEQNWETL